jgi:hypothetical protein
MTSRGSAVEFTIRAETPAGAAALAGQQARVRDLLAAHGFDLARFTVSGSDPGSFTDANRGNRDSATGDNRNGDNRNGAGDFNSPGRQSGSRSGATAGGEGFGSRGGSASPTAGARPGPEGRADLPASPAATEGTWL